MADSNVWDLIDAAAEKYGEDPAVARGIATIESGGRNTSAGDGGGVFQFTPGTWARYGQGASVLDAAANVDAGVRLLHDNRLALTRSLDRAPTAGELYLAHQQGSGGAAQLIANPSAPAAQFVGNAAITGNGGYAGMTAGDFAGLWARKMNGVMAKAGAAPSPTADLSTAYTAGLPTASGPDTGLGSPERVNFAGLPDDQSTIADPNSMSVPSPETHSYSEVDAPSGIQLTPDAQRPQGNFGQGLVDAYKWNSLTSQILRSGTLEDFDPNAKPYEMTEDELKRRLEGLDPSYASWFADAITPQMADRIEAEARQHQAAMENLAALGWKGTALNLLAGVLDPTSIGIGIMTGGLGDAALAGRTGIAATRAARIAVQAGAGAASNAGIAAALNTVGPPDAQGQSVARAALMGAVFGSAYGVLSGNPATAHEAAGILSEGRRGLDELSGFTPKDQTASVGAAQNADIPQFGMGENELTSLKDTDVARTAFGNARWSVAAQVGRSDSPATRAVGAALFEDGVGKSDYSLNPFSAELELRTNLNAANAAYARFWKPAFDAWRKDMGYGSWEARLRVAEFEDMVYEARTNPDPTVRDQAPDYVKGLLNQIDRENATIVAKANNPLLQEGLDGRPVKGFGTVPEDETYLTRIWSPEAVARYVQEQGGMIGLTRLISRAIASAQPEIDEGVLSRLADNFAQNIYKRSVGILDDSNARMFAADDLESLEKDLVERGLSPADAASVRQTLERPRDSDAGKDTRAKRRVLMDVHSPFGGTAIKDLLVRDVTYLQAAYRRHMFGRIALARQRIRNPTTGGMIVDGITGDGDWQRILGQVREDMGNRALPTKQIDKTIEALQFGYDRITGVPHHLAGETWARTIRLWNKYNIVRLGSSFVFPHSGQISSLISQIGLKALLDNIPSFRRIVSGDGEFIKANGISREIEQIWGSGTERMVSHVEGSRWDHELGVVPYQGRNHWYGRADHALTSAGHAMMTSPGSQPWTA